MSSDIFRNMLLNISENEFTYIVLSYKEGATNQDMFYFTSVNKVVIPLSNMAFENNYKTYIENNDISKLSSIFYILPRLKNQNIEKQELGVLKKKKGPVNVIDNKIEFYTELNIILKKYFKLFFKLPNANLVRIIKDKQMSFKSELNRVMNQITELYNTESEKNSDIVIY